MPHDVSKLPKWAQDEIAHLQRSLAAALARNDTGPQDSDTFVHEYDDVGRDAGTGLGKGTTIRFVVDPTTNLRIALRDDGDLDVFAAGVEGATGNIHMIAVGSNQVRLRVEPHRRQR